MSYLDINGLRVFWTKIKSWVTNQGYGTYSKPQQGIPKTDLANSVQTSLSKADSALQTAPVTSVNSKTGAVSLTASDVGLGNVGNFKAVSTQSNQGLTVTEKENARTNIGAGTSSFSGNYTDLSNKPTIPTKVSQLTNDSGYTTNTGTITGITMNGDVKGTSGVVNLGGVLTEQQFDEREAALYNAIQDNSLIARKNARVEGNSLIITNDTTTEDIKNLLNYLKFNIDSITIPKLIINGELAFGTAASAAATRANLGLTGAETITLLWTNASPTSEFGNQTIGPEQGVDLSGYDAVEIIFALASWYIILDSVRGEISKASCMNINGVVGEYIYYNVRSALIENSGITFGDAYSAAAANKAGVDNNRCIPYKIYGIKEV